MCTLFVVCVSLLLACWLIHHACRPALSTSCLSCMLLLVSFDLFVCCADLLIVCANLYLFVLLVDNRFQAAIHYSVQVKVIASGKHHWRVFLPCLSVGTIVHLIIPSYLHIRFVCWFDLLFLVLIYRFCLLPFSQIKVLKPPQ